MFCPKCGALLRPKVDGNKKIIGCSCGYSCKSTSQTAGLAEIKEHVKGAKDIHIIEEVETKPIIEADCKKCGHKKAYFWSIQTRAGDEPETRFFKCEKCKHTWREYK